MAYIRHILLLIAFLCYSIAGNSQVIQNVTDKKITDNTLVPSIPHYPDTRIIDLNTRFTWLLTSTWSSGTFAAHAGKVQIGFGLADYSNGGEAGGADRTIGNTDNFGLGILTNNIARIDIQNDGQIFFNSDIDIAADGQTMTLTSENASGVPSIEFDNSSSVNKLLIDYNEIGNVNQITGSVSTTLSTTAQTLHLTGATNLNVSANSGDINLSATGNVITFSDILPFADGGESLGGTGSRFNTVHTDNVGIRIDPVSPLHVYQDDGNTGLDAGITVEQDGATGDAVQRFILTGVRTWTMGVDNSLADQFAIRSNTSLTSQSQLQILTTGETGINKTPRANHCLDINTTTNTVVALYDQKDVTIEQGNFGNANSTDFFFNRADVGFNQSEFYMFNNNDVTAADRFFKLNYTPAGTSGGLSILHNGSVGIGIDIPDASALLDMTSITQGFLPPRMTTTQRDAISSPATGLMIYNTTTNSLQRYDGTSWGSINTNIANTDLTLDASRILQLDGNPLVILDGADVLFTVSSAQSQLEFGDSRFQADAGGLALDFGVADHFELNGDEGTTGQVLTSNGANLPPTWGSPSGAKLTFAQMLALASPAAGDAVFVTDAQVQATFTYNSTWGKWTAPEYIILNNDNGSALAQGDVVQVAPNTDFSVATTTITGDPEVIGVVVVGGADAADVLVKTAGEVIVNKIAGTIDREEFLFSSTTAGSASWAGTGGIGDFGIALETSSGTQVRMQFVSTMTD